MGDLSTRNGWQIFKTNLNVIKISDEMKQNHFEKTATATK